MAKEKKKDNSGLLALLLLLGLGGAALAVSAKKDTTPSSKCVNGKITVLTTCPDGSKKTWTQCINGAQVPFSTACLPIPPIVCVPGTKSNIVTCPAPDQNVELSFDSCNAAGDGILHVDTGNVCPITQTTYSISVHSNVDYYTVFLSGTDVNGKNYNQGYTADGTSDITIQDKFPQGNYQLYITPGSSNTAPGVSNFNDGYKTTWYKSSKKSINLTKDVTLDLYCSPKCLVIANKGLSDDGDYQLAKAILIPIIKAMWKDGGYYIDPAVVNPSTDVFSYDILVDKYLYQYAVIFIVGGPCTYDSLYYYTKYNYDCCATPQFGNCGSNFQTGIFKQIKKYGGFFNISPTALQDPSNWVQTNDPINKDGTPIAIGTAAATVNIMTWNGGVDTETAINIVIDNINNYYTNFGPVHHGSVYTIPEKGI